MATRYNPNNGTGRWYEDTPVAQPLAITVDGSVSSVSAVLAAIALVVILLASL